MKNNRNIIFIKKNSVKISYGTHGPPYTSNSNSFRHDQNGLRIVNKIKLKDIENVNGGGSFVL